MIQPKGFTSVAAPVLLQPGYEIMLYALINTNTLQTLNREDAEYSYYLSPDESLENDSSLLIDLESGFVRFSLVDRPTGISDPRSTNTGEIRTRILNQVGRRIPSGHARKEFIETIGQNYLVMDNETNTISGGSTTTFGYLGDSALITDAGDIGIEPELIGYFDNGATFQTETWFTTPTANLYSVLNRYELFFTLLEKAGMVNTRWGETRFLDEGKKHTVFVPSDQALQDYRADTLGNEDLTRLLKYHFVQGELIWTHGLEASGSYPTLAESPDGTGFESLELNTGIDYIDIMGPGQSVFCHIPENGSLTNNMTAYSNVGSGPGDDRIPGPFQFIVRGVVHRIDSVLTPGF